MFTHYPFDITARSQSVDTDFHSAQRIEKILYPYLPIKPQPMSPEVINLIIALASLGSLVYTLNWMHEMQKHTRDSRLVLSVMLRVLTKHAQQSGTEIDLKSIENEVRKVMGLDLAQPTEKKNA